MVNCVIYTFICFYSLSARTILSVRRSSTAIRYCVKTTKPIEKILSPRVILIVPSFQFSEKNGRTLLYSDSPLTELLRLYYRYGETHRNLSIVSISPVSTKDVVNNVYEVRLLVPTCDVL